MGFQMYIVGSRGRLFSVGSTDFWHPWQRSPGPNSSSLGTKHSGLLKIRVGGTPWGACTVVRRSTRSGILLHTIDSSSKCTYLEACGTWGGKLVEPSLPVTQAWRQQSFLTHKTKKKKSFAWNWEKKKKKDILISPEKRKRYYLQNPQQDSGWEIRLELQLWGRSYGRGAVPRQEA